MLSALATKELVHLSRNAVAKFISRFLAQSLTSNDLETIAETLDVNENLILEDDEREKIVDSLFLLSSTEINGPLTYDRARSVLAELMRADDHDTLV